MGIIRAIVKELHTKKKKRTSKTAIGLQSMAVLLVRFFFFFFFFLQKSLQGRCPVFPAIT